MDLTESRLRIESALADPEFRSWFKRIGLVLAVPAGLALVLLGYFWFTLPPLSQLERIAPSLITRMYDKDSTLIREFYTERRVWIPVAKVPERQIKAVLSIEDQGFYRHGGIDMWAIPAALLPAMTGKRVRGASTLTQQLTKLVFLGPERSLSRKFREILLAIRIERTYTKNEILEFYLNEVYLGAGAYGFSAAAERYFSRPLDKLTLGQQALMAGLLQRPETLRPDKHPSNALSRRNTVLRTMESNGVISRAEMEAALALPLEVEMKAFEQVAGDEAAYFVETVRKELEGRWGKGFLDSAGTRIRTTLDRRAQALTDSTLVEHLAAIQERMNIATMLDLGMPGRLRRSQAEILGNWEMMYARFDSLFLRKDTVGTRKFPEHARYHKAQGAVVVIENATGAVRALSGGLDFRESNYNRATMSARSPGSAFKPIVYAATIDKGTSPGGRVVDKPFSMPDPDDTTKQWRPHNLEYDYEGGMTLRRAFYRSRNIPAIQVALSAGLDTVAAYALRFGISRPLRPVPAMALGACDASPLEMASAFSVFPNGGEWVRPRFLERIIDRNGSSLLLGELGGEHGRKRVMSEAGAWIMAGMLRDVNIRGTAAEIWASGFYHPSGGKTGTSNDYRDAWYIGFTKRYTTAVWVGTDDHSSLGAGHSGTDDAMPIWLDVMRGLHRGMRANVFEKDFPRPAGVTDVRLCKLTGRAAQGFCDSVATDYKVTGVGEKLLPCKSQLHIGQDQGENGSAEGQTASDAGSSGSKGGSFLDGFLRKFKSR